MPLYLTRFSYTPATWAKLINNPEDRRAAAKEYIEGVGGNLQGFWYAFGDHDGYNLWEAPDNRARDRRRRGAELSPDDGPAHRRGDARGPAEGWLYQVSAAG
jgi:GYD domain